MAGKKWSRTNVVVDNIFTYNIAHDVISQK